MLGQSYANDFAENMVNNTDTPFQVEICGKATSCRALHMTWTRVSNQFQSALALKLHGFGDLHNQERCAATCGLHLDATSLVHWRTSQQ